MSDVDNTMLMTIALVLPQRYDRLKYSLGSALLAYKDVDTPEIIALELLECKEICERTIDPRMHAQYNREDVSAYHLVKAIEKEIEKRIVVLTPSSPNSSASP
jgi:hypothetical protein